jgi:hypothetical protein
MDEMYLKLNEISNLILEENNSKGFRFAIKRLMNDFINVCINNPKTTIIIVTSVIIVVGISVLVVKDTNLINDIFNTQSCCLKELNTISVKLIASNAEILNKHLNTCENIIFALINTVSVYEKRLGWFNNIVQTVIKIFL